MSDTEADIQWVARHQGPPETQLATGDSVVILPESVVDGRGRFPGTVTTLAKALQDGGVDASYSHASDEREWIQLLGEAELGFALAVGYQMLGSGAWEVLRAVLSTWILDLPRPRPRVKLDLRIDRGDQSSRLRISGAAEHVVNALDRVPEIADAIRPEDGDSAAAQGEDEG